MECLSTRDHNGDVLITGTGSLEIYSAKDLQARLDDACQTAESVTVDFSHVDYIDSAIESRLARAGVKLHARGKRLRVIVTRGSQPCRALGLIGLSAIMDIDENSAG